MSNLSSFPYWARFTVWSCQIIATIINIIPVIIIKYELTEVDTAKAGEREKGHTERERERVNSVGVERRQQARGRERERKHNQWPEDLHRFQFSGQWRLSFQAQ